MLRLLVRLLLLLITLVGIGLAFVMPWAAERQQGVEAGRWRVYDRAAGFRTVTATVPTGRSPAIVMEIHTEGPLPANLPGALFTVTASAEGHTVLAQAVGVAGIVPRVLAPQSSEHVYKSILTSPAGDAAGPLLFRFAPGDAETGRLMAVDMAFVTDSFAPDPRLPPLGYVFVVVGFVGLVTSFRSRPQSVRTEPPPPRWGRG